MRTKIIAGNWKMNGTLERVDALITGVVAKVQANIAKAEVAVCPSYVFLPSVAQKIKGSSIALGAQDLSDAEAGAYTGEISGSMLKACGCHYVIVGHSERRNGRGESNALVAAKFKAAQAQGLTPILCVGELLEDRESGTTNAVVAAQLDAVIEMNGIAALANSVIAYEPVWAIGTGKTATPEQAQEVHKMIRDKLAALDAAIAEGVRIQYGGSMNAANAAELLSMPDIDGGLIGGASLNVDDFLAICQAAEAQS
jgi:triosephosphate isomerase (TIM)